jgi:hypothetical protein
MAHPDYPPYPPLGSFAVFGEKLYATGTSVDSRALYLAFDGKAVTVLAGEDSTTAAGVAAAGAELASVKLFDLGANRVGRNKASQKDGKDGKPGQEHSGELVDVGGVGICGRRDRDMLELVMDAESKTSP